MVIVFKQEPLFQIKKLTLNIVFSYLSKLCKSKATGLGSFSWNIQNKNSMETIFFEKNLSALETIYSYQPLHAAYPNNLVWTLDSRFTPSPHLPQPPKNYSGLWNNPLPSKKKFNPPATSYYFVEKEREIMLLSSYTYHGQTNLKSISPPPHHNKINRSPNKEKETRNYVF